MSRATPHQEPILELLFIPTVLGASHSDETMDKARRHKARGTRNSRSGRMSKATTPEYIEMQYRPQSSDSLESALTEDSDFDSADEMFCAPLSTNAPHYLSPVRTSWKESKMDVSPREISCFMDDIISSGDASCSSISCEDDSSFCRSLDLTGDSHSRSVSQNSWSLRCTPVREGPSAAAVRNAQALSCRLTANELSHIRGWPVVVTVPPEPQEPSRWSPPRQDRGMLPPRRVSTDDRIIPVVTPTPVGTFSGDRIRREKSNSINSSGGRPWASGPSKSPLPKLPCRQASLD